MFYSWCAFAFLSCITYKAKPSFVSAKLIMEPHCTSEKVGQLSLASFGRRGNWASGWLSTLPKVTECGTLGLWQSSSLMSHNIGEDFFIIIIEMITIFPSSPLVAPVRHRIKVQLSKRTGPAWPRVCSWRWTGAVVHWRTGPKEPWGSSKLVILTSSHQVAGGSQTRTSSACSWRPQAQGWQVNAMCFSGTELSWEEKTTRAQHVKMLRKKISCYYGTHYTPLHGNNNSTHRLCGFFTLAKCIKLIYKM